jgi:hypothetical protein
MDIITSSLSCSQADFKIGSRSLFR